MSGARRNHRVAYIVGAVLCALAAIGLAVADLWIPAIVVLVVGLAFLGDAVNADKKMSVNERNAQLYGDEGPVTGGTKEHKRAIELAMADASRAAEERSNKPDTGKSGKQNGQRRPADAPSAEH